MILYDDGYYQILKDEEEFSVNMYCTGYNELDGSPTLITVVETDSSDSVAETIEHLIGVIKGEI